MNRPTQGCAGKPLRRTIAACVLLAAVLSAAACAPVSDDGANGGTEQRAPEIAFAGQLVFIDGKTATSIDGVSGARRDAPGLEGELGWSGFAALRDDGALVYESLADGMSSIHLSDGSSDVVLTDEVTAVHGYNATLLVVSRPGSTHAVPFDGGSVIDLGLEEVATAAISQSGTELAFSSAIPTTAVDASLVEYEQGLAVRSLTGPGLGQEVERGWFAYQIHWLDDDALAYTRYPLGGADLGDVVLVDRRSNETTVLASAARVIDADGARQLLAIAHGDDNEAGMISIADCSDPSAAVITSFDAPPSDSIDSAALLTRNGALVVAFRHEDSTSTLVHFEASTASQRTIAEIEGVLVPQMLSHPSEPTVFIVTERQGAMPDEVIRAVNACDVDNGRVAELAIGSAEGLLTLVGVIE